MLIPGKQYIYAKFIDAELTEEMKKEYKRYLGHTLTLVSGEPATGTYFDFVAKSGKKLLLSEAEVKNVPRPLYTYREIMEEKCNR